MSGNSMPSASPFQSFGENDQDVMRISWFSPFLISTSMRIGSPDTKAVFCGFAITNTGICLSGNWAGAYKNCMLKSQGIYINIAIQLFIQYAPQITPPTLIYIYVKTFR